MKNIKDNKADKPVSKIKDMVIQFSHLLFYLIIPHFSKAQVEKEKGGKLRLGLED